MSSYTKLIVFVLVLVILSVAVVMIDSSMDNINKSMPEISDGIVNGDKDYNESVELVNNKNFQEGMEKATSAGDNYNKSLNKLLDIQDKYSKDLNGVHKEYIGVTIEELELKLKAVDELKEAIGYFEIYSNYTGTTHASEANDLMYESLTFQKERNSIVSENSNLFKQNFI